MKTTKEEEEEKEEEHNRMDEHARQGERIADVIGDIWSRSIAEMSIELEAQEKLEHEAGEFDPMKLEQRYGDRNTCLWDLVTYQGDHEG